MIMVLGNVRTNVEGQRMDTQPDHPESTPNGKGYLRPNHSVPYGTKLDGFAVPVQRKGA